MARYSSAARWYDTLSLEHWLYRGGRMSAIDALQLTPGDRVLDLGCGTGLSMPHLAEAVGPSGLVHGIEPSTAMLAQARRRARMLNVRARIDLTHAQVPHLGTDGTYDAALFGYSLSIIGSWMQAWRWAVERVRPGGRIAVLDSAWPVGRARALAPGAAVIFAVGGVHPGRAVWQLPGRELSDVASGSWRGGHVRLGVGTVPGRQTAVGEV